MANAQQAVVNVRDGYETPVGEEGEVDARPVPTAWLLEFLATVDLPVVRSSEFCLKIASHLAVRWQSVLAALCVRSYCCLC